MGEQGNRNKRVEKVAWSVQEVAEALDVDHKTVRKEIAAGAIPHFKVGRLIKIPAWWVNAQIRGPSAASIDLSPVR
jgi:excisionase family DNA binding protein